MRQITKIAAATALAGAALAFTATGASAAVVCNANACWHVKRAYTYPPTAGIVVHPNHWRWGPREHFVWREHEGRGYWRNGVWVTF